MIKKYKKFIEAISGTELVGRHMGPNYPTNELPTTLKQKDTDVIYSELFGRIVTYDEYQDLYFNYLKKGGKPLQVFTKENLDKVLSYLEQIQKNESIDSSEEDEQIINDIFISLTTEEDFTYHLQKRRGGNASQIVINLLKIQKDVTKTDNLYFYYQDIKDEICHLVSYLQERYYNTIIEKKFYDGKYGVNPQSYTGKDNRGKDSILTSVEVIYKG